jgi:subtilisin family serine protease
MLELRPTSLRRTCLGLAAAAALAISGMAGPSALAAGSAGKPTAKPSQLGKHDRELLADAKAKDASTVTLLIAASPGSNKSVVAALQNLGATVAKRDDDLGYVRAIVPIGRAEAAANLDGIVAADLDEILSLDDPRPAGTEAPTPQTPPGADTPRDNAYMPIGDTGAAAFTAAHPTWDGRGTTIGILDSGIDLDHPALATTTTGARKITDWVTATDPFTDDDPTWVNMADQVTGSAFTYKSVAYTAPAGSFRFGIFAEDPRLGGELGSDVNRDGDTTDAFGVLWTPPRTRSESTRTRTTTSPTMRR